MVSVNGKILSRFTIFIGTAAVRFWAVNFALVVIFGFGVAWIGEALDVGGDELAGRRDTLGRYEQVLKQAGDIEALSKEVSAASAKGEFISGENDSLAAANLQARLKFIAEEMKVSVRSIAALPSKSVRGLVFMGARIEVAGSLDVIHALARRLESEIPVLVIEQADFRRENASDNGYTGQVGAIIAQLSVFGVSEPRGLEGKSQETSEDGSQVVTGGDSEK